MSERVAIDLRSAQYLLAALWSGTNTAGLELTAQTRALTRIFAALRPALWLPPVVWAGCLPVDNPRRRIAYEELMGSHFDASPLSGTDIGALARRTEEIGQVHPDPIVLRTVAESEACPDVGTLISRDAALIRSVRRKDLGLRVEVALPREFWEALEAGREGHFEPEHGSPLWILRSWWQADA